MRSYKKFPDAPREVKIETYLRLPELTPKSKHDAALKKWKELDRLDLKYIKAHSKGQDLKEEYTDESLLWVENVPI